MHGGIFQKSITVVSNAKNDPNLRISFGGTLKPEIQVSTNYIRLKTGDDGKATSQEIILTTEKEHLKIKEVVFKPYNRDESESAWQKDLSFYPKFELKKVGKNKDDNSYIDYSLQLTMPYKETGSKHGKFFIKTNHPKKEEIEVSGLVEPFRQ